MPEYVLVIYEGSIDLICDECGSVNHWGPPIELDEIIANADDHTSEAHSNG